jgi:hypothetical protein
MDDNKNKYKEANYLCSNWSLYFYKQQSEVYDLNPSEYNKKW